MIYRITNPINVTPIIHEYFKLEKNIQWLSNGNESRQCGIQYITGEDPFTSATGKLRSDTIETEYNVINPLFQGTIFEELIKEHNLFRTRLMWAGTKSCYSLHKDKTQRLHIPLITNDQCLFVFPEDSKFIYLPSGYAYIVDTTRTHSFCNFSQRSRLHLVGCIGS
jgi:hypothetical protein